MRVLFRDDRAGELPPRLCPRSGVLVWKFGLSFCSCCVEHAGVRVLTEPCWYWGLLYHSRTNAGWNKKHFLISEPDAGACFFTDYCLRSDS